MDRENGRQPGLIHIYCGEGKGKTTAAVGLIARAAGHGMRILLVQFLKNGKSGELASLRRLPQVRILTGGQRCDTYRHSGLEKYGGSADSRFTTRVIRIKYQYNTVRVPLQNSGMVLRKSRAL